MFYIYIKYNKKTINDFLLQFNQQFFLFFINLINFEENSSTNSFIIYIQNREYNKLNYLNFIFNLYVF